MIAETYDLLKRGAGFSNNRLHELYAEWNEAELASYLVGITADIFCREDDRAGGRLIDHILDEAGQKGTGKWTSQEAMDLGIPVPTIDAAVSMRELSGMKQERAGASQVLGEPHHAIGGDPGAFAGVVRNALHAGFVLAYVQGLEMLRVASGRHRYGLNVKEIARIWREGCIIRSAILERIYASLREKPGMSDLLTESGLGGELRRLTEDLQTLICSAASTGIPVPALMASLAYFDALRSAWLPANLIQAQRDYFGAHGYERVDEKGSFHTEWEKKNNDTPGY